MKSLKKSPASTLIKISEIVARDGYRLRLRFSDGAVGEKDFSNLAATDAPMTRPLRDLAYFGRVFVEQGALTWPNGLDLAPWSLYEEIAAEDGLSPAAH